MSFLALLAALVLSRSWTDYGRALHRDQWYESWQGQMRSLGLSPALRLLPEVLLPALAVQLALELLQPLLFGLAWIAAATAVLLYSLGRGDLGAQSERYRSQCRRGDFEGALLYAQENLGLADAASDEARSEEEVHRRVQGACVYQAHQRWFAVFFYFLLLGPAGALAYRMLQLSAGNSPTAGAALFYVDWVPGRLAAAAFVITGNFVESADELYEGFRHPQQSTPELLYSVAMAATGQDREPLPRDNFGDFAARQNEAFLALIRRSAVCWVVVISVLVLL